MNMKSIAAELGIAPSTVSRVINGNKNFSVSEELRKKILALAGDYRPNPMYQAMRKKDNRQITIILPNYLHIAAASEVALAINTLTDILTENGYSFHVLISPLEYRKTYPTPPWKVAGAVTVDVRTPELIREIDESGLPYISLNGVAGPHGVAIKADDVWNMNRAMEHLYELGHRKIAFLNAYRPPELIPFRLEEHHYSVLRRTETYLNFCEARKLPVLRESTNCDFSPEDTLSAGLKNGFTAFVTYNFRLVVQAVHFLKERGLRVPEDVSVLTFDNPELARYFDPPLTCVEPPFEKMGRAAAEVLLQWLKNPENPPRGERIYSGKLIQRRSAASPGGKTGTLERLR